MNDVPKPKLGWRLLRWGLIGMAVLVTLAAVLITEENWRGERDWKNYKRTAEARGERFDIASIIPPKVPDEQNFFCAPIVAECLEKTRLADRDPAQAVASRLDFKLYRGDYKLWPTNGANWRKGKPADLAEWQRYFRNFNATSEGKTNGFRQPLQAGLPAADVLIALSEHDAALEELREATKRPLARMPLNYENGFEAAGTLLPWLAATKRFGQFLQLRITAELENNQSDKALDDIKLFLRFNDANRNPRFLITDLVRIAMCSILLEPVYEGITQRRWSDAQLAELERELGAENLLTDYVSAMNAEKINAVDTFEKQRITRKMQTMQPKEHTNEIVTVSLRWMPAAYFYQNELSCVRLYDQMVPSVVDLTNRTVSPANLRRITADVEQQTKYFSPYKVQASLLFPAVSRAVIKFAIVQAELDLARTACALERFHLTHGNYPESLDELAPQFIEKIPNDLINGQPLHYRRVEDGKYVLYSVGWNETDDGGVTAFRKGGTVDPEKGDWVWKN